MKSWKTTIGGLLSGAGLAFAQFFPEWSKFGGFAAAVGTVLLGMAARDNNVTSEQAGAHKPVKKTPALAPFVVLTAILFAPGCASIAPGNDPLVVNAERTAQFAFQTVDGFLEWEASNRPIVPPQVTTIADDLRKNFPQAHATLRNLTKAYKANRSPENAANLNTALAVVQTMLSEAQKYLPPPKP